LDWTRIPSPAMSAHMHLIRNFPWQDTTIGSIHSWPDALRQAVLSIMANPDPRLLLWGDDHIMIYNESCISMFGERHPRALGSRAEDTWSDIWSDMQHLIKYVQIEGRGTRLNKLPLVMERNGYPEDTFWSFNLIPIVGPNGNTIGVMDEFSEVTEQVVSDRRRDTIVKINRSIAKVNSIKELWFEFLEGLEPCKDDIPYALLYTNHAAAATDPSIPDSISASSGFSPQRYALEGSIGLAAGHPAVPLTFDLADCANDQNPLARACYKAWKSDDVVVLQVKDGTLPESLNQGVPGRAAGDKVQTVCIVPLPDMTGNHTMAFLTLAMTPRRPYDSEAAMFAYYLRDILVKSASAICLPEEQRRARQKFEQIEASLAQQLRATTLETERLESRYARMAQMAPIGMYAITPDSRTTFHNKAYLDITGITEASIEAQTDPSDGLGWGDRIHEDDQAKVGEAWVALAERGIPLNLEYRIKKDWKYIDEATGLEMNGETWLQGTAIAEIGIDGSVVAVQGFVTEISLKKASERLLSEKLEDALEHKRQADRFIDMTSHEMRNPLSAILQSADGILTTLENNNRLGIMSGITTFSSDALETVLDAAQTIILCAQHQGRIVDDILTLSKLDSNLLVVSPDTVDMPSLLEKCFKMHEAELIRAKIGISLRIHEGFRNLAVGKVMLDSSRLLQVIINLLTNAIKFTQFASHKEITVHLDASSTRPKEGMYGAPYVPFRANRPEHHFTAEWGTGDEIFLSISVQDSGKGMNEEELKLLFNRFSQASPKTYKQYGGSGLGLFISRELTDLQDGQIGVHSEPDRGSTFSFYIKARRAVDEDETVAEGRLTTPTLNTSVTYTRDPASNALEASVDNAQHDNTQHVIRKMAAISNDLAEDKPHLHVLVVEDNIINQRVMAQQLRRLGCTVHLANHGLEALEFLRKTSFWAYHPPPSRNEEAPSPRTVPHSNTIPLSVVLMDLEMPVLGGLETVKRIRCLQSEGSIISHVPVIAVTANARSEQIAVAIDHGMDSVVTKPFRIPELVPQMEDLVERVQQGKTGRSSVAKG
ncbi:histidine kinase, partial [Aureobasidium melanogenum CBS 110374]